MKKFLLGLMFLFLGFNGISQTVIQKDWTVVDGGQWASFYWGVTRLTEPDYHGKYYYYVYFYSNSYFSTKRDGVNYDRASTYIRNINVRMNEYKYKGGTLVKYSTVNAHIPYFTCDWVYDELNYGAWFWSYSPYNKFKMTFDRASAFDHSIY